MAIKRRSRSSVNIWPGFVDALATLLMVIIFLLMIFVVAQFYLGEAITGRDEALERLNLEILELADLLELERSSNLDLTTNLTKLSAELKSTVTKRDSIATELTQLHKLSETLTAKVLNLQVSSEKAKLENTSIQKLLEKALATETDLTNKLKDLRASHQNLSQSIEGLQESNRKVSAERNMLFKSVEALRASKQKVDTQSSALRSKLENAQTTITVDKKHIKLQISKLLELQQDIEAMQELRESLEADLKKALQRKDESNTRYTAEKEISVAAKAQIAKLNRQVFILKEQLQQLNASLEASELRDRAQKVQISDLGKRLNVAMAQRVQKLTRYRSEFFGRLRDVLGDHPDIQIVGDRFIFQSEVLFESGSADIGPNGKPQLAQLARTMIDISRRIPADINWILRIDGHTDREPISNDLYRSNWELSTSRAISVVKFLIDHGIPEDKLAATGFGEFQPLVERSDEFALSRNRRIEIKLTEH